MIPFNIPCSTGLEIKNIQRAIKAGKLAGNGQYLRKCQDEVFKQFNFERILFTPSGTSALEMAAMLCHFESGNEVIIPSFTHVSTANAFIRAGATIRFGDCLPDHPNMDIDSVKKAINPATKAIVLVHYAGMACDPENFRQLADEHNLLLIEDAAHAIGASYRGKWLGSYGDFATFSFHETKNIHCGHGGMLIVNRADQEQEALEIWHHGTDRLSFEKKEKSFYAWTRPGGSFVMPELNAAFLYPQLLQLSEINAGRMKRWQLYYELLHPLEIEGVFKLPDRMSRSSHNAHIFYLLTPNEKVRNHLLKYLYDNDILAVFHYIPLHLSTFGKTLNEKNDLLFSERIANRIVRLPLYDSISNETILHITDLIHQWSVIHSAKKRFGKFENQ